MSFKSYRIEDMPSQLPAAAMAELAKVEVATIGHYLHDRFMSPELKPIVEGRRIAGTAVTLSIPGPDSTLLYHAMDRLRPGDVLVVDRAGDNRHACWGGFMAVVAKLRKVAGIVIDGQVTDLVEIKAQGVPTWARGVSPITTKLLNLGGAFNLPISCGGVTVNPGDAVLADDCGITVLPPAEVAGATKVALADQADEGQWLEKLRAGKSLQDMVDVQKMIAERNKLDGASHG
jgi:4-hydroxy-4-methyl-2-oxoglutarate aldolase